MILINNAYDTLSDPQRRLAYDASLNRPHEKPQKSRNKTPQPRPPELWTPVDWKIQGLIILALVIALLAGYEFETVYKVRELSGQYVGANSHFVMAVAHEAFVSLPLVIPGFGMVWGVLGIFVTGAMDKAVIMTHTGIKATGPFLPYLVLASAVKILAYFIGMYRNAALLISIKRRRFCKMDGMSTQAEIIMVVIVSMVAGLVEHAVVRHEMIGKGVIPKETLYGMA